MSKISRKRTREDRNSTNIGDIGDDNLPIVGKSYMVERDSEGPKKGEKMLATIVHVDWKIYDYMEESLNDTKADFGSESDEKVEPGGVRKKLMFYVHYVALDRRNDEWVKRARIFEQVNSHGKTIMLQDLSTASSDMQAAVRGRALTRSQRRIHEEFNHLKQDYSSMDAQTARLEREHEERTKIKNIPTVIIGRHKMQTWYYSPFPSYCNDRILYMCEYCLLYTPEIDKFKNHILQCQIRQPPGNEIYRKDEVSIFEIDGSKEKLYSQCLCLLSKLFMDHKTLYFDVDDFLFYVMCEVDEEGAHIVGYFSREVESTNNLACIMVFPPYQDRGYGKFLIQLSYEISNREGYIGTPEKPLSDLGKVSYRSFWWWTLLNVLHKNQSNSMTATELSYASGISVDDIVSTLGTLKMVRQYKEGDYIIRTSRRLVEQCIKNEYGKPPRIPFDTNALKWKPAITRRLAMTSLSKSERRSSISALLTPPIGGSSAEHSPIPNDSSQNNLNIDFF